MGNGTGTLQAFCGFNGGFNTYRGGIALLQSNTGKQTLGKIDVARMIDLRDDNGIQHLTSLFNHFDQVAIGKRRIQRIDAHGHGFLFPVQVEQGVDNLGAGCLLGVYGNTVLQVEHNHVSGTFASLAVHLCHMAGYRQVGSTWFHQLSPLLNMTPIWRKNGSLLCIIHHLTCSVTGSKG